MSNVEAVGRQLQDRLTQLVRRVGTIEGDLERHTTETGPTARTSYRTTKYSKASMR